VNSTLAKLRSVMCNCGARTLAEFREGARFVLVSPGAMREGSTHDVILKRTDTTG
jgi:IMP dehydrogenase